MATKNATIWMYQTQITPERNCIVDDLSGYLKTCAKIGYTDFQYQKIALDMSIKIDKDQLNFPVSSYNYVSIHNDGDIKTFYYFVIGQPRWLSQSTVEYQLSMDTLNTFKDDMTWTSKTHITRQHKDRFYKPSTIPTGDITLNRKIDDFEEGITPVKTLISDVQLTEQSDENHYIVYRNNTATGESTNNPIEVDLYPNNIHSITVDMNGLTDYQWLNDFMYFIDGATTPFIYKLPTGIQFTICQKGSALDTIYGIEDTRYDGLILLRGSIGGSRTGDLKVYGVKSNADNKLIDTIPDADIGSATYADSFVRCRNIICNPIILRQRTSLDDTAVLKTSYVTYHNMPVKTANIYYCAPNNQTQNFNSLNRTDTTLIKIIKTPYSPVDDYTKDKFILTSSVPGGFIEENPILKFRKVDEALESTIAQLSLKKDLQVTLAAADRKVTKKHSKEMESKLKNSNFYGWKFYFDNFNKEIMFERTVLDPDNSVGPRLSIKFKSSSNLSSNFTFKFEESGNLTYRKPVIYDDYLNVNRQNEVAIYNSEYLNYIKNGYNYDKKAIERQSMQTGFGIAASAVGVVGSVIGTVHTGGISVVATAAVAASSLNNIINSIFNQMSAQNNFKQKLEAMNRSAASASSTTDLDLLEYYSGFKLHSVKEKCTDEIENSIYDLFRLTGYACDERAIPEFNTRTSYNFIQCEPDIKEDNFNYSQDYLNDFKDRFKVGVTIYHKVDGDYDWNQVLENYETWIVQ